MAVNIQLRRGTAAEWTAANPTLAVGEIGIETDTDQFKIGNGTDDWDTRPYGGLQGDTGVVAATSPITYDSGTQTVGIDESAISITASQLSDVTATATELNYVDGVTSAIQDQLDAKEPLQRTIGAENGTHTLDITDAEKVIFAIGALTVTVPDGVFSAGHRIDFIQDSSSPITFAAGAGVTIRSKDGILTTSAEFTGASLLFASSSIAYLVDLEVRELNAKAINTDLNTESGATYTLSSTDANTYLQLTDEATVTVSTGTDFAVGDQVTIICDGTPSDDTPLTITTDGATIAGAGTSTTSGSFTVGAQYEAVSILCVGSDDYRIIGNIAVVE